MASIFKDKDIEENSKVLLAKLKHFWKKLNKIIRNKPQYSITLQQLIDEGKVSKFHHLRELSDD